MRLKQIPNSEITNKLRDEHILYCVHDDYKGDDAEKHSSQYCMVETRDWEKIFLYRKNNTYEWEQRDEISLIDLVDRCWYIYPNADK